MKHMLCALMVYAIMVTLSYVAVREFQPIINTFHERWYGE